MTPQAFVPLVTYPDANSDALAANAVAAARWIGADLNVLVLNADIPQISNAFSRLLIDVPDMIRVASPMYVKLGLRNAPNIYPSGLHLDDLAVKLGRERVRRAELVLRLLRERAPELVGGRGGRRPHDLGIPEP